MKLTVVRHGETVENKKKIIQAQSPGHLTPKGIEQAKEVATLLSNDDFDVVYCSDLQRCVDTAAEIMVYHKGSSIHYSQQIREMNLPGYEGKPWGSEVWDNPKKILTRHVPSGESFADMWQRVEEFTNDILAKHPNENVLFVTHGGPVRGLVTIMREASPERSLDRDYPIPNCGVWRWEVTKPLSLPDL